LRNRKVLGIIRTGNQLPPVSKTTADQRKNQLVHMLCITVHY